MHIIILFILFTFSISNGSEVHFKRAEDACVFGISNVWKINSLKKRLSNKERMIHTNSCYKMAFHHKDMNKTELDRFKSDPEMSGCSFGVMYFIFIISSPEEAEKLNKDDNEVLNLVNFYCKKYKK